jgi:hypothetical protein
VIPGFAVATSIALPTDRLLQMPFAPGESGYVDMDALVSERIRRSADLPELARSLRLLLSGGFGIWEDGTLYEIRVRVDRLQGLTIVIHTREHGPPHFHVVADGINASFAIDDGSHLAGTLSPGATRLVTYWYRSARPLLVRVWNESRPSDCPVGPISAGRDA